MGLGGTAKKLQRMIDMAEQTYNRINEVREQLNGLRTTVEETGDRVESLEAEQREQRALLEALADEQGVDIDDALANVGQADSDGTSGGASDGDGTDGDGVDGGDASADVDDNS